MNATTRSARDATIGSHIRVARAARIPPITCAAENDSSRTSASRTRPPDPGDDARLLLLRDHVIVRRESAIPGQQPAVARLREFLARLDAADEKEPPWMDLLGPPLVDMLETVTKRADELAPQLRGCQLVEVTGTPTRADAVLKNVAGGEWRATCIVDPTPPHRIVGLRFDERPARCGQRGGFVIVLAGTSSVGKSSLAMALQDQLDGPWLHVDRDAFLLRLPRRYQPFPDTWGPVADGIHPAVRGLVSTGNLIIFDTLAVSADDLSRCRTALAGLPSLFVEVTCDPGIAADREARRLDRAAGLAIGQALLKEQGSADLIVDTSRMTPEEAATAVVQAVSGPLLKHHTSDPPEVQRVEYS